MKAIVLDVKEKKRMRSSRLSEVIERTPLNRFAKACLDQEQHDALDDSTTPAISLTTLTEVQKGLIVKSKALTGGRGRIDYNPWRMRDGITEFVYLPFKTTKPYVAFLGLLTTCDKLEAFLMSIEPIDDLPNIKNDCGDIMHPYRIKSVKENRIKQEWKAI